MKVIGFTGYFGAGKGTAISIVNKLTNALVYSTSDEIAEDLLKQGLPVDRIHKFELANKMRAEYGSGYWAQRVVDKIKENSRDSEVFLVDALRNEGEIELLKNTFQKNFLLFSIEAPIKLRYSRIVLRNRDSNDLLSFEEFVKSEEKENKSNPYKFEQSLSKCASMADFHIDNSISLKELCFKISNILISLNIRVYSQCSKQVISQ